MKKIKESPSECKRLLWTFLRYLVPDSFSLGLNFRAQVTTNHETTRISPELRHHCG